MLKIFVPHVQNLTNLTFPVKLPILGTIFQNLTNVNMAYRNMEKELLQTLFLLSRKNNIHFTKNSPIKVLLDRSQTFIKATYYFLKDHPQKSTSNFVLNTLPHFRSNDIFYSVKLPNNVSMTNQGFAYDSNECILHAISDTFIYGQCI